METASDLHKISMDLLERADQFRSEGDTVQAAGLYREALEKEEAAANLTPKEVEPSRSILFKSAAFIAIRCGQLDQALRLVELGLEGTPSDELAEELRALQKRLLLSAGSRTRPFVSQPGEQLSAMQIVRPDLPMVHAVDKLRQQIQTASEVMVSLSGVLSGATAAGIVNIFPSRYTPIAAGKSALDTIKEEMGIERRLLRIMGISLGDFFLDRGNLHTSFITVLETAYESSIKTQALILHPKSDALKQRARWEAGEEYYSEPAFFDSTTYIETDGAARIARRLAERHRPSIEVKLYREAPTAFVLLTSRFAFFEVYTYAARGASGVPMFQVQAGASLYTQLESHFSRIWEVSESVESYQPLPKMSAN